MYNQDKELKKIISELHTLAAEDQRLRKTGFENEEIWKQVKQIDFYNTEKLKEIIAKIGWPTISKIGKEAAHQAWLIAQHADHDTGFQEFCLELMKKEPDSEVVKADIAYLEDRVRVNKGKPQLYGTQFYTNEQGVYQLRPIEDEQNIDTRRSAMRLPPMKEYQEMMIKEYRKK